MKRITLFLTLVVLTIILTACKTKTNSMEQIQDKDITETQWNLDKKFNLNLKIRTNNGKMYRWNRIYFYALVDEDVELIEHIFDFWDGTKIMCGWTCVDVSHAYKASWIYPVSLTVTDKNWIKKTITREITIEEIFKPIAAFRIFNSDWFYIQSSDICKIDDGEWGYIKEPSFPIKRFSNFIIDANISVNTKWETGTLEYFFKKMDDTEYYPSDNGLYEWNLDVLGCYRINVMVIDKDSWEKDENWIRFNVK